MRSNSSRRGKSGVVVAALSGALALGALPMNAAHAAPNTFGPVTGLVADADLGSGVYNIDADWDNLANAVKYTATLKRANGTVVAQANVTQSDWSVDTAEPALSTLQLTVVGVNDRNKKSKPATVPVVLPDETAPVGVYTTDSVDSVGTITQVSLSDDTTPAALIVREVKWGDGGDFVAWGPGDSTSHTYPSEGIYHPEVRLTDQAGNSIVRVLTLVVGDEVGPSGTYAVNPGSVWANPAQTVTVTQLTLADNFSDAANVTRVVLWGDDSAPEAWAAGDTVTHQYTQAGSYAPVVRLTDEAGNLTEVTLTEVVVAADTTAPATAFRVPKKGAVRISKWRTVRGTVADVDGTGVDSVSVRAVQKRGQAWYAYKGKATWAKSATKAGALAKAMRINAVLGDGTWTHKFKSLRKGKLLLDARGVDRAGNASAPVKVTQTLKRR